MMRMMKRMEALIRRALAIRATQTTLTKMLISKMEKRAARTRAMIQIRVPHRQRKAQQLIREGREELQVRLGE